MNRATPDTGTLGLLAERYAAGRMNDQEERDFEIALLEQPELAAQVDAAHRMRVGFRRISTLGEIDRLVYRQPRDSMMYAIAAALLLLFLGGGSYIITQKHLHTARSILATSLREITSRPPDKDDTTRQFILTHTRGSSGTPTLSASLTSTPIGLEIIPEIPEASGKYRIMLESTHPKGAGEIVADIEAQANQNGSISIFLDPSRLGVGDYRISVLGSHENENFPLRIKSSELVK